MARPLSQLGARKSPHLIRKPATFTCHKYDMKIIKDTDDILILQGYSWLRFAAATVFLLSTPFWIWVAATMPLMEPVIDYKSGPDPLRRLVLMGFAVAIPLSIYIWVRRTYTNWQLILEADYDKGSVYKGLWGARQRSMSFSLSKLAAAKSVTYERPSTTINGDPKIVREHNLALAWTGNSRPTTIGRGSGNDIYRMVTAINAWLKRSADRAALDSSAPQP